MTAMITTATLVNMNFHTLIGFTLCLSTSSGSEKKRYRFFKSDDKCTAIGRVVSFCWSRAGTSRAMPGICYVTAGRSLRKSSFDDVLAALHRGDMTANDADHAHRND
jgi:hypothetical protein